MPEPSLHGASDLRFLSPHEHAVVRVCADLLLPAHGAFPGGGGSGAADYVDRTLGAFASDPPRVWAAGPTSGRHGGSEGFSRFLPLSRLEQLAWRTRIEGSLGLPERERLGPMRGWQQTYREGIATLGADFLRVDAEEQARRLAADPELRELLFTHTCEATFAAPEYGGNRDAAGWRLIDFAGDVQPRGWDDDAVRGGGRGASGGARNA